MSLNRVVAVLTPLVFAPLAGAVTAWLAEHFPGFNVEQSSLEEIFIAGALIALAPAAQWLHGWQKYEARQAALARDSAVAPPVEPTAVEDAMPEEAEDLEDLAELEELDDIDELDDLESELLVEDEEPAGVGG